ncbi:YadA C-terminal domain-containing protein [Photobacterium leiognathi]|uniref:YadA C-terminal domain-containing protein n=1 Tax=Photobacterium leiognathi TaxID=553611 RepID=UPI00298105BD|nr:YadA-like family protein [Photobacterium leiognathi]
MKKLLLATMITSTSFGAAATDSTNPPLEDGLNPILIINPIDPGFGVNPPNFDDLPPVKDTNQAKADIANKHLNGKEFNLDAGKNAGYTVSGLVVNQDGVVEGKATFVDENGNEVVKHFEYQATGEYQKEVRSAVKRAYAEIPVVEPIDPGFDVDPIIPTVDEKIAFINGHMANVGEGNASLVRDKNGNVQLTFTDQVSGETRQINMSELTEDQVAVITSEARNYYDENKNGVAPIVPTVDEKIEMVNQKFADLGLSAHVTESANGQSYLVYGDGESILLNDLDAEGIADIKARATEAIKDDQIDNPISPIDGEKPLPSEGQKIVEGINKKVAELKETYTGENGKKVIDGIEDKVAELKEDYTGENGKKVIDGIEDKIAELKEDYTGENGKKVVDGLEDKVAELKSTYTGDNGHAAKQSTTDQLSAIYKSQAETDSRQDSAISTNAAGIKENKEAITFLNAEIDRLDNKMDGVMAGVHAVNNARPYLTAQGQTAIGAGVGFAGSNSAVAVGLAHAVSDNWSVSATMNVTTGDESELSGGFGTQFTF